MKNSRLIHSNNAVWLLRSAQLSLWAPPGWKQDHQGDGCQSPGPEAVGQVISFF